MRAEEEHLVWQSLHRLPESYREALILFYRDDQSLVYFYVARRMAALLVVLGFLAIQAVSEREWLAALFGFLLIPLFIWLGVCRWLRFQRDQAGTVFRGMAGTVVGFFA